MCCPASSRMLQASWRPRAASFAVFNLYVAELRHDFLKSELAEASKTPAPIVKSCKGRTSQQTSELRERVGDMAVLEEWSARVPFFPARIVSFSARPNDATLRSSCVVSGSWLQLPH